MRRLSFRAVRVVWRRHPALRHLCRDMARPLVAAAVIGGISAMQPPRRAPTPPAPAPGGASAQDTAISADIEHALHGQMATGITTSPHLALTARRAPSRADSLRGEAIADTLRRAIAPYTDVQRAVADGYRMFSPETRAFQKVFHYTRLRSAVGAAFGFDAAHPTSLLYVPNSAGGERLIGAMYTAPARFDEGQLDRRIPLSLVQWHRHVNTCFPKRGSTNDLSRRDANGDPLFGVDGRIATKAACEAAGGRWFPQLLGWMVHVRTDGGDPWRDAQTHDHGHDHRHDH